MQTTATPIDSDDSAIDNITVIPLDLFDDSDIAAAMGYMSWLGNPTSQETSDDSSRFQMPHQSIDGTGISCCSTKPKKHRRKQDMIVRQHDDIEFVGSTVCAEEKSQPSPLGDISNTIVHQPASSSSAANTPASIDLIKERRISIKRKLENSALSEYILFTEQEECDILRKANVFLSKVKPDPKYCFAPGTTQELSTPNDAPIVDKLEGFEFSNDISPSLRTVNPQPVYVVHAHSYPLLRDHKPGTELPIGTQLLKPEEKLVELVARAIDESPDELLQVQQVYTDIMLRYPYFAFMDKLSTNSWRSSVRHALYQKWFRKIAVGDEKIGNKGCFWTINRRSSPREWTLPSQARSQQDRVSSLHRLPSTRDHSSCLPSSTSLNPASVSTNMLSQGVSVAPKNEVEKSVKDDYPSLPKPTLSTMWQPQSAQSRFRRNVGRLRPYTYSPLSLTPNPFPYTSSYYQRRPFPLQPMPPWPPLPNMARSQELPFSCNPNAC